MKINEPENVVQGQDEGGTKNYCDGIKHRLAAASSNDDNRDGYSFSGCDNSDNNGDGGDDNGDGGESGDGGVENNDGGVDNDDGGESDYSSGSDGKNNDSITVRIDSAVLDCPVCFEPLDSPLFQCINGHIICSQCCNKVHRKCPTCTLSISHRPCLPFESIIKSNRTSCTYSRFGCYVPIVYAQRHTHMEFCLYAPCFCPFPACRFRGNMNDVTCHLASRHHSLEQKKDIIYGLPVKVSLKREQPFFILQTVRNPSFLLLNSRGMHSGNQLSVACIRPGPASCDFQYELEVAGDMGKKLRLEASPENARKWMEDYRSKFFLYVPDDIINSSGVIDVKVCIRKLNLVNNQRADRW